MRHYGDIETYLGYGPPIIQEEGATMTEQAEYRKPPAQGLIMGVDPGPTESAYAIVRPDYTLVKAAKRSNVEVYAEMEGSLLEVVQVVAIECLACYGERMIGRETWETAYVVGDLRTMASKAGRRWKLYDRPTYANAIAGTGKVTDAMLYQALRLRFGAATKDGPLYGLRGHSDLRSAYSLAVYYLDCLARPAQAKGKR